MIVAININYHHLMIRFIKKYIPHFGSSKKKQIKPIVDYNQRGQFRSPLQLKVNDILNDFEVTYRSKFSDFEIDAVGLKCKKHGTSWVHLDCQEQKNSIAFIIKCSEVPHGVKLALQKLLQCGSKKYPVRNPIEFMTRRSFNSQNLSYTTNDYILYAYQTPLLHDHSNLMDIFLHMMFNPLLRQQDFRDIVWRYSLRGDSALELEGDTAHEIKNLWNYSEMRAFDSIQKNLLGKIGLAKNGQITSLKYQDLLQWHVKVFDSRNMLIISHGDFHPAKLIQKYRQITQQFKWQERKVQNNNSNQTKFSLQQSKTVTIQHLQPNPPLILSFKLDNVTPYQRVLLSILSHLLFDMPDSVMMQWNTPQTPYPKHFGFQGTHFNIGISLQQKQKAITQKDFIQQQKQIRGVLQNIYKNKFPNSQIQQCLYHLEDQYYSKDGMRIITGCLDTLIQQGPSSLESTLNVKSLVSKVLRTYRQDNIFQQLLKKYILDNKKYIRICGKVNPDLIEDSMFEEKVRMGLMKQKLTSNDIEQIKGYRPPDLLQDYRSLPKIDINQLEIFEEKDPMIFSINEIPVYHVHKCDGIKVTIKYDITDIDQDQIKLLPVICQSFPYMGGRGINNQAFRSHVQMYIKKMEMKFQTNRTPQGMKLFLYLNLQFSDRNAEFGFNLCTSIVNDHNDSNIQSISQRVQRRASENYNELTQKLTEIHGRHLAATRSSYAMIQDPIFQARSICGLASDILKIANPKVILQQVGDQIRKITSKLTQKNRISVLFQCRKSAIQKYRRYLEVLLNPLKVGITDLEPIKDQDFTPSPCLKYFPNYSDEYLFEAFSVPYYKNLNQVPSTLVLSAIINQNITRYNQNGGSFLFKGALVSCIQGNRKKALELEGYYKKIEDIDEAKQYIFQKFRRYTAADIFYTGVSAEDARIFKQAVALVDQSSVLACLEKYILPDIKEGKSSILAIGPHLGSYEPMIKKGWVIQRSIQDMSLKMESESPAVPQIEMSKYINIY